MNFAAWLSVAALLLSAAVTLRVSFGWRRIAELKDMPSWSGAEAPAVSIIVSALNEADTIAAALTSLLAIDYPALEIIVINDRSTDDTPRIIDRIAAGQARVKALHMDALPQGWLGKNHALQRGAEAAGGDYLLFTDADALFVPSAVSRALAYCEKHRIDHLTLFFNVIAHGGLLRMLILSFAAALLARFAPWKVNESRRHYIGVGGFNLVRREAYFAIGGHAAMPLAVLDDLQLGRMLKSHGLRQAVLFGTDMVAIEWYRNVGALVRGLEKNIYAGFGYQLWQLAAVSLLVIATRLWPWAGLLFTHGATRIVNVATVCIMLLLYADMLRVRGWPLAALVFTPVVPLVELFIWWRGSLLAWRRGAIFWRGTPYRLKELRHAQHALDRMLDRLSKL